MPTTGIVNYHVQSDGPQAYRIDPDGVEGRLEAPEQAPTEVCLHDVRGSTDGPSFAKDGIAFLSAPTAPTSGPGWESSYNAELRDLLTRELGAVEVRVFDHTLRVDDPQATRRPARNVHTDYSPNGARDRLVDLLGPEQAREWEAGHYAFINVWRPVSDRVRSAPLGFVRPRSVRPADWVLLDLIYPDRVGQIMGLVHHPRHEWVYCSAMTPSELVVFNIHDNRGRPPVAHSAIDLIDPAHPGAVRQSLESRTLVRFSL